MTPKVGNVRNDELKVRIPHALKVRLQAAAKARRETVTALVERAIVAELDRVAPQPGGPPGG